MLLASGAFARCQGIGVCDRDYFCGADDGVCPDDMVAGLCDECGLCCDPDCGDCSCKNGYELAATDNGENAVADSEVSTVMTTDAGEFDDLLSVFPKVIAELLRRLSSFF
ncbi:TPA: hypothetical protein HA317_04180 [Candidatus Woesearchaeota archaeon]|nr:hypothetical protein [Candidatus Woesearchaeota archaeon]